MPYEKNKSYTKMTFCLESNTNDFYTYCEIEDLIAKCEMFKEKNFKCRTIGQLKSINGRFYIGSIKLPINNTQETYIRVSFVYMKTYPKSTLVPNTVQIFGTLQFKKELVIVASVLQVVNASMAIRLCETLRSVTSAHLARVPAEDNDDMELDNFGNT